jgi:hypothetical protein
VDYRSLVGEMIMKGQFENTPKKTVVDYFNILINFPEDYKGNHKKTNECSRSAVSDFKVTLLDAKRPDLLWCLHTLLLSWH